MTGALLICARCGRDGPTLHFSEAEGVVLCSPCLPYDDEPSANGASSNGGADRRRRGWPSPMSDAAYHGLVGKMVRAIEPHTEADPHAILVQALAAIGNVLGRGARFRAEADEHATALFALIVGETSKGRKGTSYGYVRRVVVAADSEYVEKRMVGGLSSGEGLVWAVRDATAKMVQPKDSDDWEEQTTDPGIEDKRLLVIESEFAQALKVMARPGNTLSPALRGLWDNGCAGMLTKNDPSKATNAHVSVIGHITRDELRREMTATEQGNGFGNRFLMCCARRSKMLPRGGNFNLDTGFAFELSGAVTAARRIGLGAPLDFDDEADALWTEVYPALSEGRHGLLGAVTGRAEAQTVRLALLYAVLDGRHQIGAEHLAAALEVWRYCDESACYVFGDATGDTVADEVLTALRNAGAAGVTRTDISRHFQRHRSSDRIGVALTVLDDAVLAKCVREATPGRPVERWFAVEHTSAPVGGLDE